MAGIAQPVPNAPVSTRRPGLRGWLILSPLLLWILLFVIVPNFIMLAYSFGRYPGKAAEVTFLKEPVYREVEQVNQRNRAKQEGEQLETRPTTWSDYELTTRNYKRLFDPAMVDVLGLAIREGIIWAVVGAIVGAGLLPFANPQNVIRFLFRIALVFGLIASIYCFHQYLLGLPRGKATEAKMLWRTIQYAGMTTIICLVLGYPVAYFIGRAPEKWRNILLLTIMVPFWTSFLIRTYAWINILSDNGLLNSFLIHFKLINEPLIVLGTPTAVIVGLVYNYLPFMILPIYSSVEKLDNALVEAAMDLGASPLRAFSQVIFPLTRPGVYAGILLVFIPAIGMFAIFEVMGLRNIPNVGERISKLFLGYSGDWAYGSALGMTVMFMFIIAYAFSLRKGPASEQ